MSTLKYITLYDAVQFHLEIKRSYHSEKADGYSSGSSLKGYFAPTTARDSLNSLSLTQSAFSFLIKKTYRKELTREKFFLAKAEKDFLKYKCGKDSALSPKIYEAENETNFVGFSAR